MVDKTSELPGWYALQERLKATALTNEQINELKVGDMLRVHRPASIIPGNDAVDVQGPIEKVLNYGSDAVIAVEVLGIHFDRAAAYFYAV